LAERDLHTFSVKPSGAKAKFLLPCARAVLSN
jgi:hypothetical protein